jgi:hypothetical protein
MVTYAPPGHLIVAKERLAGLESVSWPLPTNVANLVFELFTIGGAAFGVSTTQPLIFDGSLIHYAVRKKVAGDPYQCLTNCKRQVRHMPGSIHYIGYSLFSDDLFGQAWKFHCWLLQGSMLIETVEPMPVTYWGRPVVDLDYRQRGAGVLKAIW